MHLLVDGQALQTPSSRTRGIGRYSSNLLRALGPARPHWRVEVVQNAALPPVADEDLGGLPTVAFRPPLPAGKGRQEVNERYYADWLTARRLLPENVTVAAHLAQLYNFGRKIIDVAKCQQTLSLYSSCK
jgi:hypothetical protein